MKKPTMFCLVLVTTMGCDCGDGGLHQATSKLSVDPDRVDFGRVPPGQSASRTIRLSNIGQAPIEVGLATEVPFSVDFSTERLAGGETVEVTVRFAGGDEGELVGALRLEHDAQGPYEIPLVARVEEGASPCSAEVTPDWLYFEEPGAQSITIENDGDADCVVEQLRVSSDDFELDAPTDPTLRAGATLTVPVRWVGTEPAEETLSVRVSGELFTVELYAGEEEGRALCVSPTALHFDANGAVTRELVLEACGDEAVTVNRIEWTTAVAELAIDAPPSLPFVLEPEDTRTLTVRFTPSGNGDREAVLAIGSDAEEDELIEVIVTVSDEMLPEDVGRFLYYWSVAADETSDIVRLPLQGNAAPTPFWGESTGKGCPGCHQVSPDGRYVAIVELTEDDTTRAYVVDTTSNTELTLAPQAQRGMSFTWRPDVTGSPSYRFAFGSGGRIHVASVTGGYLGELPGADAAEDGQGMPTWGSDGRIAFVAGDVDDGDWGFLGATSLYVVPESGGTATPIAGAANNGRASYYPAFSPNARWIAYTDSASGETYSAPDARVRLVRADGSGQVLPLDVVNGTAGATSFPTWSVDGTHLSVSSDRPGGRGGWDIYTVQIDPTSGAAQAPTNLTAANTPGFEHGAQWSR